MSGDRISFPIPTLFNGVSQQAPSLRMPSQCEEQLNALSSIADGLRKRPPSEHIAQLRNSTATSAFVHEINRDTSERYAVILTDGDLEVYDLNNGNACSVAFTDGKSYLSCSNPMTDFRCVTIADHTFVLNKSVDVAMDTTTTTGYIETDGYAACAYVKRGICSQTYTVKLDGTSFTYSTPAPSGTADYSTNTIANNLTSTINGNANYVATQYDNTIKIRRANNADFTFSVTDTYGDGCLVGIKNEAAKVSDLPPKAWNGLRVKVAGDNGSSDGYWLKYVVDTNSTGVWRETIGPGIQCRLNALTMPHILVRNNDGSFTFYAAKAGATKEWARRTAGDALSAPEPSFVGTSLNDLFFFRNRLGFVADENVILSEAGEYFNFWPTSVMTTLATNPIDVGGTSSSVSILYHAVPFHDSLLLFSDQTQFQLGSSTSALSGETVRNDPTTAYECSKDCKPVAAGPNVYFVSARGDNTALMEYFVDASLTSGDAVDITAHCARYIPSGVFKMASAPNSSAIFMLTDEERNAIYVYKYFWNGQEKLQSAWSKWTFPTSDTILSIASIENYLYMVVQRSDGVYLEKVDLQKVTPDSGMDFVVHLDRLCQVTGTYDSGTKETSWTLPYVESGDIHVVLGPDFPAAGGLVLNTTQPTTDTVVATGDWSAGECYLGRPYTMRYTFSEQFVREGREAGASVIATGRLQLLNFAVVYTDSGYFRSEVTSAGRSTQTKEQGGILGTSAFRVNAPVITSGTFKFMVLSKSNAVTIDLVNDSHFPSNFQSAEWAGAFVTDSRRV